MTSPLKDKSLTREKLQRLIDQARHLVAPRRGRGPGHHL